jgi:5-methylthioadenosine/S-adenosylhomocysteine deaminase
MVNGKICVDNGKLVTANMRALIDRANAVTPALFARRTRWLEQHGVGTQRGEERGEDRLYRL